MSYSTLIAFSATVIYAVLSAGSGKVLNAASDTINDHAVQVQDKVPIFLYFETLSDACFDSQYTLRLAADEVGLENLDIHFHPYGNASTSEEDGKTVIECQHGPKECYYNKFIACAMDILKDIDIYIRYNECVLVTLNGYYSEDIDHCATTFKVDGKSIKECATSDRGLQLLKHHGEETKKRDIDGVPRLYVNGKLDHSEYTEDLIKIICAQFIVKPKSCHRPS